MINWTHNNKSRRFHIPFPVAYGVDKAAVREAVLEAIRKVPFTTPDTPDRRSQVWLVGFGDSSLNFELVVWPTMEAVRRPNAAQAAYAWAIDDALRAGGFEIPFNQVDLRVRSLFGQEGEAARDALGLKKPGKALAESAPAPAPAPAPNDAAEDLRRGAEQDAREAARTAPPAPESKA